MPLNKQLPLIPIGGGLIVAGLVAIALRFLPLEMGLPPVLVGGAIIVFALQRNGVDLPKIPSWSVWIAVAVALFAIFYIGNNR